MIEVVIPAHNAGEFLRATLESVAAQTRPPRRISVVNDRSRDGTKELAQALAAELRDRLDICVLDNAGPPGPSAARNTAIRASDQPWIALLDADDLLEPGHHAALAAMVTDAPEVTLAFGDCCLFESATGAVLVESHHAKSGLLGLPRQELDNGGARLEERFFQVLVKGPRVPTSACLLRRDSAVAAGLFDETMMFAEDADLFLRLAWLGEVRFTLRRLTRKRVHGTNLSREENRVRFAAGGARAMAKLRRIAQDPHPAPFTPTEHDRRFLDGIMAEAVNGYLFDASLAGIRAYAGAMGFALREGHGALALQPRHLGRLVVRGLAGIGRDRAY